MKRTILLSKYLKTTRKNLESQLVFDAVLGIDTKLFIDPKLLISSEIPEFENINDIIYKYFEKLLKWHKLSARSSRLRKEVQKMLVVPEPKGVSIGYGNKSDRGTTSISENVANNILHSASEILAIGVDDVEILEILGLFVNGYGADSISDLMIHISYTNFCEYTQRVCDNLRLETNIFDINGIKYRLPKHPFNDSHIIFIPHVFLRKLPLASNWGEMIEAASQNSDLRTILNDITVPVFKDIFKNLQDSDLHTKEKAIKRFNELLKVYTSIVAAPYNLSTDKSGYYQLMPFVENQTKSVQINSKPKTVRELIEFVRKIISQYRRSIEDNGGNKLLYRRSETGALLKDSPHNEDVAQILFYLIADSLCDLTDVALSGESDAGKGPVDFSLSTGYHEKVLVEIKKSKHTKLISGYKKQIATYKKSENAKHCFYVVVDVKEKKSSKEISDLDKLVEYVKNNPLEGIELVVIDGLIYPSPSKLS